ncbi:hypothetical protein C2S52_015161 [Perilla frutescens var. hirtella]|nr:hypothetical protein C2S52_015161 [Perilla frutescens var. hirtella]
MTKSSIANSMTEILPRLMFFAIFPAAAICFSSNETDLLSLLALKSAIVDDPLGALISWNETTPFCSWNGVSCSRRHPDRVAEIDLRSQGLVGSLSPHVGNLSLLTTLILQNNTFHGPIPQEIGNLRRLESIEFSNNSFSGAIPRNLSRCANLHVLNVVDNDLSGNIPAELGSLSKLRVLGLSLNKLSGYIPPSIGNITSIKELALTFCSLSGKIPELLAHQSLVYFLLAGNSFTGTIPSDFFNITALQYFEVSLNKLHGVIPSTIGLTLPNLKDLLLTLNQFHGTIPVSISNISSLEIVDFSLNYFTGPMPRVGRLTNLQEYIFNSNLITDDTSFISSLTNSTKLEILQVGENQVSGSLPDSLANFSAHIFLLSLESNQIHGKIPSSVGSLIILSHLLLFDNNLSGNVPPSLANCSYMLELDLSLNNFSGLIPPEIMSLSSLSVIFNLSHNAFEGPIPYEVGSLKNLAALDLSHNRLSGPVPRSIGKCTSLEQLYLNGNFLEGEIPLEMGALMGLQDLDLSTNNLSGPIPEFLEKLSLKKLNLSFNRLHGEVPTIGVFKNNSLISLEGNQELCGGIWELKLPPCPSRISTKKNSSSTLLKILIPILLFGGICLMLCALFIYKRTILSLKNAAPLPSFTGVEIMRLSYADLLKATDGFSETNVLGFGRFGSVYKGILDDGETLVAVKVLNLLVRGASKSFVAECNALRDMRHRNLVKILSVCESVNFQGNDFKALVYEFKANGSLEKWLHQGEEGGEEIRSLNMMQRLNVAIDIAQAIEYLHFGTDTSIVHGDLKPSNILLDHDMTACVGDFGLAKIVSNIVPPHESNSSIGIRGTLGYVPPEYGMSDSVSVEGDVYSFGIVLLEMFTNKRPTDGSFDDRVNFHSFVATALPDHVFEIVDPLIHTKSEMKNDKKFKDCMISILSIGVTCSKEMPRDRMPMKSVVTELLKIQKMAV